MPSREDEIGALWVKTSPKVGEFLSGKVKVGQTEIEVVIFHNDLKQPGERTPDWRVYRSQPRDGGQQELPRQGSGQTAQRPATELNDDIPW